MPAPRLNPIAPTITGDIYRMVISGTYFGQTVMNVFDYMNTTVDTDPRPQMVVATGDFITQVKTPYLACVTSAYEMKMVTCICVNNALPANFYAPQESAGTIVQDALPLTVAAVTTKFSNLKGQHGRGRYYMPGVPKTFVDIADEPNFLNDVGLVAYDTLKAALLTTLTGIGVTADLVISTRPIAPSVLVSRAIHVNQMQVDRVLGNQRRRRPGRGI